MKISSLLKETKTELLQVTWPTRSQTINYTILVIVFSLVISLFLGLFDFIFVSLLELIV